MRTPTVLVLALLTMQPRLEAEESILAATRISVGGAKLKTEDAKRVTSDWSEKAGATAAAPKKPSVQPPGVGVRRAKKKA